MANENFDFATSLQVPIHVKLLFRNEKDYAKIIANKITYRYPLKLLRLQLGILQVDGLSAPFEINLDASLSSGRTKQYPLIHDSLLVMGATFEWYHMPINELIDLISMIDYLDAEVQKFHLENSMVTEFQCKQFLNESRTIYQTHSCKKRICRTWKESREKRLETLYGTLKSRSYMKATKELDKNVLSILKRKKITAKLTDLNYEKLCDVLTNIEKAQK